MVSSISRSYQKELGLFSFLKKKTEGDKVDPKLVEAMSKLPSLAVPRPHPSAAGLLPLWDLFHDDASGLGIIILRDGTYRCTYQVDGVHVSGFDEVRLYSLMNHFTGFLNGIDTSVQFTIMCHNMSKREYFERHKVDVVEDEFLKYVARCVENDQASLLSRNFIPELRFFVTFCYRPPREKKPSKKGLIGGLAQQIQDACGNRAARQSVGSHFKNVNTLLQRAQGYMGQLGACGMSGRPVSALEYFQMLYKELNPVLGSKPAEELPEPKRPECQPLPAKVRRVFPDMEPATIREQLVESHYDFHHPDYVHITDVSESTASDAAERQGLFLRTLHMSRLPERTSPLWLQPLLRLSCEWRINIYAHKLDKEIFRKQLQRKQAQATANTYQSLLGPRHTPNQEEAEKAQEAAHIGSELYTTNMEVFNSSIYITLIGDSLEELNRSTELVR